MSDAPDPHILPEGLPIPEDDGAAAHLEGAKVPPLFLPATSGGQIDLAAAAEGTLIVYLYPRTGAPRGAESTRAFYPSFPPDQTAAAVLPGLSARPAGWRPPTAPSSSSTSARPTLTWRPSGSMRCSPRTGANRRSGGQSCSADCSSASGATRGRTGRAARKGCARSSAAPSSTVYRRSTGRSPFHRT